MTTVKTLDAQITKCSNILGVNVSESHGSATSIATIQCVNTTLDVGDFVEINLGYVGNCPKIFEGYVKRIEKSTPEKTFSITCNDVLTRAVDYFIVSSNANSPYTYRNISAEDLIGEVLGMAGLSNFDFYPTSFTFGINSDVEVNLVSSYDYSRMICDLLAIDLWADQTGKIILKNRKPYPMDGTIPGEDQQPGWVADSSSGTYTDTSITSINVGVSEKDLRNKIVVYGKDNFSASAQRATSLDPLTGSYRQILPNGFYKASVLASPLIEDQGFAQDAADYNLGLYNKLTYELPITLEGSPSLHARTVITVNSSTADLNKDWYIYQLDHSWGKGGYVTNLLLRR